MGKKVEGANRHEGLRAGRVKGQGRARAAVTAEQSPRLRDVGPRRLRTLTWDWEDSGHAGISTA